MRSEELTVPCPEGDLGATLGVPDDSIGLVAFAHGSGSSRFSRRNRSVADALQRRGLATLLLDLLTPEEERIDEITRHLRFDVELLARRLIAATTWARASQRTRGLPIAFFGASTGAAAALIAAARDGDVAAVVSRGGRPDLAWRYLERVVAPTLLLVGNLDEGVLELNEAAYERLRCRKAMTLVPGATHLFEEPGTLERVAELAGEWLERCVGALRPAAAAHA